MQSPIQEFLQFIAEVELSDKDIEFLRNKAIEDEMEFQEELKNRGNVDYEFRYTL